MDDKSVHLLASLNPLETTHRHEAMEHRLALLVGRLLPSGAVLGR